MKMLRLFYSPRFVIGLLAGVSMVSFNNWIAAFWLNHRLVGDGATISDFSATTEPYSWLFRSMDIVSGLFLVLTATAVYLYLKPKDWILRVFIILIAVLGIANIFDASLMLPCTSLDSVCNSTIHLWPEHMSIPSHTYSSTIIGICFLAMPLMGLMASQAPKIKSRLKAISVLSLATTGVFMFFLLAQVYITSRGLNFAVEFSQYVQMLIFAAWFLIWLRGLARPGDL